MKKLLLGLGLLAILALMVHADNPHGQTVVAEASFLNQTSSVGTTTLYTPANEGDYQVSMYLRARTTNINLSSNMDATLSWTDEFGTASGTLLGAGSLDGRLYNVGGSPNSPNQSIFLHSSAGNPIQFATTYTSGGGSDAFDIYVAVIKQ